MSKLNNDKVSLELDLKATKAQEEIHRLTKSTEILRQQNTEHRKEITRLAATEGDYSAEIRRLNGTILENTREIEKNKREIVAQEQQIDISRKSASQLGKELKKLKRELANTSRAADPKRYRELEDQIRRVEKAHAAATRSTRGFLTSLMSLDKISTSIKGFFMGLGMAITTQVIGAFKKMTSTIVDFEKANSKLAAVLGTDIDGVSKLTDQAKFLGRTTTATASEVTGLQTELAKLGFSQDVIEKLTPATLKFAKAVDTDLSSAAAFAGAAMRMFNKDAGEAENVMASFAVATTKSALDFNKLEASLSTVGPVANSFGFSLEDTTALLGQLSNAGFDASSAATATRNILLNLADANGALAQALGKPVTDLDSLVAGLKKLNAEGVDLATALELTDKRSVAAFTTFLNGTDNLLSLRDAITGCTDDFNKMAKTMTDNAAGSLAGFLSALEGLILKFFDFRLALRKIYEWGTELVNWVGSFVDALSPMGVAIGWIVGLFGGLISVVGSAIGWFTKLFTKTRLGIAVLNALVAAFAVYRLSLIATSKRVNEFIARLMAKKTAMLSEISITKIATTVTHAFNNALRSNPIGLLISGIALLVTGIISFITAEDDATESTEELSEAEQKAAEKAEAVANARKELAKNIDVERNRLLELQKIAEDENKSRDERLRAIKELNKICPDYNAQLAGERGQLVANKKALDEYLFSLEKQMRIKYFKNEYEQYVAAQLEAQRELNRARRAAEKERPGVSSGSWAQPVWEDSGTQSALSNTTAYDLWADSAEQAFRRAGSDLDNFLAEMEELGITQTDLLLAADEGTGTVNKLGGAMKTASSATHSVVDEVKSLQDELKKLRKADPQTDEEYDRIQKRKKQIRERLNNLNGSGARKKNRREPGTYGEDSIDEATASADDLHQKNMLDINRQKGQISDAEFIIKKNKELIRYSSDLIKALERLRAETDATHTKTLDKIDAEQNKILQDVLTAQQAIDAATVKQQKELHDDSMKALTAGYEAQKNVMQRAVNDKIITQEQSDIYMMARERQLHEDQLAELNRYYAEVKSCDLIGAAEKTKTLEDLDGKIRQMTSQTLTDAGKWSEKIRELSTNVSGLDGIKNSFDLQRQALMGSYDQAIAIQQKLGQDTTALESERQRRLAALNYQYQEQMWQLQENVGLSWADEYNRELASLENMHRQGLIKEKDYQKKRTELQVQNVKKYFDTYAQLSGSMFSAIQEAEIAQVDAKYDVMIQAAKNNGEDTAALEEEKENKKLEIQKKYADVDFAIKISEIIANTAVAIMTAYKQLGPIAGPIAAALITATGIAQIATAKAERDKVKNMQPGNTAGASKKPVKAERVLSGYSEGGYTGDGDRYEVAGLVHRGEYVVPKPIMDNPRVVDAVGTIEAIRRNRRPRPSDDYSRMPEGFADGGYTGSSTVTVDTSELAAAVKELKSAVKNIRAYVLLKDIQKAEEDQARARSPFTRNS